MDMTCCVADAVPAKHQQSYWPGEIDLSSKPTGLLANRAGLQLIIRNITPFWLMAWPIGQWATWLGNRACR